MHKNKKEQIVQNIIDIGTLCLLYPYFTLFKLSFLCLKLKVSIKQLLLRYSMSYPQKAPLKH